MLDQPQKFFCKLLTVCITAKVFHSETFALYGIKSASLPVTCEKAKACAYNASRKKQVFDFMKWIYI